MPPHVADTARASGCGKPGPPGRPRHDVLQAHAGEDRDAVPRRLAVGRRPRSRASPARRAAARRTCRRRASSPGGRRRRAGARPATGAAGARAASPSSRSRSRCAFHPTYRRSTVSAGVPPDRVLGRRDSSSSWPRSPSSCSPAARRSASSAAPLPPRPPRRRPSRRATSAPAPPPERVLVLVRRRGGLPDSWIRRLRRSGAVEALAEVSRTQWLLRRSTAGGRVVDAPPSGYAIPLDTYVVDPRAYARVTGDAAFRESARRPRAALRRVRAAARPHRRRSHDAHRGPHRRGRRRRRGRASRATRRSSPRRPTCRARSVARPPSSSRRPIPRAVDDAVPDDPLTRVALLDTRPDSATPAAASPARSS